MATPAPERFEKYEIVRRIGRGGMGTVYLARDPDLDRQVAIKVLRDPLLDDELLQRFFREARAAANLRHENIITIYDVGQHDRQPFMAMEFVDGTSLYDLIRQRPSLPLATKISYIEQICAGLHFAHGLGIVHRDIKPANLMIDRRDVVRILDFGTARVEGSGMTTDGTLIGTLNYMSPEQMLGRPVDYRSDIFAVGAVAYELFTYQQAFPGTYSDGLLQRLPHEDPQPPSGLCPGLPPAIEAIVLRALAKRPDDRFTNLEQMRLALYDVRRAIDPDVALATIVLPGRKARTPSASSSSPSTDRRELLERRARQAAVHRAAAREALERRDLDRAMAACEDALTLEPDDPEAARLLADIQQARSRQESESRVRRERERTLRQRLADAELKLSKGDPEGAAGVLEEILETAEEPLHSVAVTLAARLRQQSPPTVQLPPAVERAARAVPATTPAVAGQAGAPAARSRTPIIMAAAAALLLVAAGAAWFAFRNPPIDPDSTTASRTVGVEGAAAQSPSPLPPATLAPPDEALRDAPESVTAPPAPVTEPRPEPESAPPARGDPVPTPQPTPPAVVADPPVAEAAATPVVDVIGERLAPITAAFERGELGRALDELERLGSSNDARVTTLARAVAQAATRSMESEATRATAQKSAVLAPAAYSSAEDARRVAEAARVRGDFIQSGRQALVAAERYRSAHEEARRAAAAPPPAAPAAGGGTPPAAAVTATPAAISPNPAATPAISDDDVAGIRRALSRYEDAYRNRDIDALVRIYPRLPRERRQSLEQSFRRHCRQYNVTLGNIRLTLSPNDPTLATVMARSVYTCFPGTGQDPIDDSVDEMFQLRKIGDDWIIDNTGTMDMGRRD